MALLPKSMMMLVASMTLAMSMVTSAQAESANAESAEADPPPMHISEFSSLDLSKYKGKVVYLDFWASFCASCRRSFPWMNEMQAKYGDRGLAMVGVNIDRYRSAAEGFLKETPAEFDILYDPERKHFGEFGAYAVPFTFIFDEKGYLLTGHAGFNQNSIASYEETIKSLLPQ